MSYIAILRSAQSVLHQTTLSREEADRLGERIARCLSQPGNYAKAVSRYNAADEFEVGERAAGEYICAILEH